MHGERKLPLTALFFIFSRAVFCAAPRLTERLEEARGFIATQGQIGRLATVLLEKHNMKILTKVVNIMAEMKAIKYPIVILLCGTAITVKS